MRAAFLLVLISVNSWAGEAFGVWKLIPARSTAGEDQKSVTIRIEPHAHGEVFTLDTIAADGRASTSSTILYFDGKAHDFRDSACSGKQSSKRIDSWTVEILRNCTNGGWARLIRQTSDAYDELTLEITTAVVYSRGPYWKNARGANHESNNNRSGVNSFWGFSRVGHRSSIAARNTRNRF